MTMQRPESSEYASYYSNYIQHVPEGNAEAILIHSHEETLKLLETLTEEQLKFRYAPGKWSIKEVLGHLTDTERVMSYRLLRIARGDKTPLPGFEEDEFVAGASFDDLTAQQLLEELNIVRQATLSLLRGITEEAWTRQGTASNQPVSARALLYIIAGHELHHRQVLLDRYLGTSEAIV
jgi:uncharacterized damage-inducible protein DinB